MNKQSDAGYYAVRLKVEREAANRASSDRARASHQALADLYLERLANLASPAVTPTSEAVAPIPAETRPQA
jgi:hypothetical protein